VADRLAPWLVPPAPNQQLATDSAWLSTQVQVITDNVFRQLSDPARQWVALGRQISRSQRQAIEQLKLPGIGFDSALYRQYPDASLSAQLLGFVGKDEQGNDQGYFGVEGAYDWELRGREGLQEEQRNAVGLPLALARQQTINAQPGHDLVLTIDKTIQHEIEALLLAGIEHYGAKSGSVVVMNPFTGEIYAMASYPNYDPSHFATFDPKLYRNPVISELYEPGSTLKVLTVAAGLAEKVITPDTPCTRCSGPRMISGFPIRTWNNTYQPNITIRDGLAKSDNTAMVFVQEELGHDRFLDWLRKFGLDNVSGIDLQGEAKTPFRPDDEWRTIDAATAAFGQGIAVTSINLLRAVAAIANGGQLVQPHVIREVKSNGQSTPVPIQPGKTVLDRQVAQQVTELMINAASQGDAKWTKLKNLEVAGKTGTAQIAENGKYDPEKTIASFIGFAPARNPKFIMLVTMREPQISQWGSETAAPLWYKIADLLNQQL
jgi:cell division protein FtsI/penicillin-binding protein 2